MVHVPILVRPREIEDDELRQMLLSAYASGNTITFFDHFAYQGHPQQTLEYGEALLRKCRSLAPDAYKILHKGTPFYWLAQAAFLVHDYETAAFYIDAAVSEDLRVDPTNMTTPALLFFLIDDANERQASLELVKLLRSRIEKSIKKYEDRTGSVRVPPTFDEIRKIFLRPAAAPANAHLRTLAT